WVDATVSWIKNHLQRERLAFGPIDILLLSFHSIPQRRIEKKGDCYYRHVQESYHLLRENLSQVNLTHTHENYQVIAAEKIFCVFQSSWGKEAQIGPSLEQVLQQQFAAGHRRIAIYAPSFTVDCLETVLDLKLNLAKKLSAWG
ncbi:MAG: ferrochelatase, partial [Oligoflexia bacterium]|nr:ferrochelatase [Oligoflexia bacterium]